jgi:DNA-binding transcriptional LysR family regulator
MNPRRDSIWPKKSLFRPAHPPASHQLSGVVRIGGFSSVLRSVIIPSLAGFMRSHRSVSCEFRSYEVSDLFRVLKNAEADFVILDYRLTQKGVAEHVLGQEEYVVIESRTHSPPDDLYLDHGPYDNATESFFRAQPKPPRTYRRGFLGDVYGIIDGVEQGLGRAVMSRHLLQGHRQVRILKGHKRFFRDVTLNYFEQPYYSELHKAIVNQLLQNTRQYLKRNG